MNLSMSLIARYLAPYQPECHILEDSRTIHGVRFLSDQDARSSLDYVYLGQAEAFFQDPRYADALLLAQGQNQILIHGTDYTELLNHVLACFDYYNSLEQRLYKAAADHAALADFVDAFGKLIEGAVLVFDLEGVLLGYMHMEKLAEEKLRRGLLETGRMEAGNLGRSFVDRTGRISHDLTDRPQVLRDTDYNQQDCISMYISQDGEHVGYIMIFAADRIDCLCAVILESEMASYCSQAREFTGLQSVTRSRHLVFSDLLYGKTPSEGQISRLQEYFGTSDNSDSFTLISFRNQTIRNYTIRTMIRTQLEQGQLRCLINIEENGLQILTRTSDSEGIIQEVEEHFRGGKVSMGVSMQVPKLTDLPIAYRQAAFALDADAEPGVRYCRDLALDFLLGTLKKDTMAMNLRHPIIGQLQTYDQENGTELLATLAGYLQCRCSQKDAAEHLHIHLNTLKYRLRRIAEISGIDYLNARDMLYVQLSIEMTMK